MSPQSSQSKPAKAGDHVTFRNGDLFCSHCGNIQKVPYPVEIPVMSAMMAAFSESHAKCPKTWQQPMPDPEWSVLRRAQFWWNHGEQGMSSKVIFAVMTGDPIPAHRSHPHDPDDFRRCYMLLKMVPEWRENLVYMKPVSAAWNNLVEHWNELTAMLEEMIAGKKSSEMYDLMQKLIS